MARKAAGTIGLIALCFFLACCAKEDPPLPTIRIGHAPQDHHSPLYVAAKNPDYFREHGNLYLEEIIPEEHYRLIFDGRARAEVLLTCTTGGKELAGKLSEDQLDLAFGGIAASLIFIDKGSPIRIIAPVMTEGTGLVVGTRISATNWDEFVAYVKKTRSPIRIGYKIAYSQDLILERALTAANLSFSRKIDDPAVEVTLVNLYGAKNLIPALRNDLIDAFAVNQPYVSLAEYGGAGKSIAALHELPPENYWLNHPCCVLSARDSFQHANLELTELLTNLFLRSTRYLVENRAEAAGQVAEWLEIPVEVEQKSLANIKFVTAYDEDWDRGVGFLIDSLIRGGATDRGGQKSLRRGPNQGSHLQYGSAGEWAAADVILLPSARPDQTGSLEQP